MLAVVLHQPVEDLHSKKSTLSWVIVAPLLAFAVLGPTTGKLGDLFGRRRVYLVGLSGCAIFAAFTAMAHSASTLITFRALSFVFDSATMPARWNVGRPPHLTMSCPAIMQRFAEL